ncbi:MAG: transglutaminase family protein [Nitrospina sp.]|nr:transglutaminase family protein [Nitrospina sp.]
MGIQIALYHLTRYRYDKPIQLGPQTIRLRPAPHTRAPVQSYSLKVSPKKHFLNWQQDPFGNFLARVVFPEKVKALQIEVDLVVDIRAFNPFDFFLEDYAQEFPFKYEPWLADELEPYLEVKESGPLLKKFLKELPEKEKTTNEFLVNTNQALNDYLKYIIRMEPGIQACEETLQLRSGSCRDMAWLLCQIFRHHGLATRFASGYLAQLKADIENLDGPPGPQQDITDLHAWTEVYLPGAGWVGLDPTSGNFAAEGHIPLCCTPNPSSAAPITGSMETCESTMDFEMSIVRIEEDHRATKPYTEKQWGEINALGHKVEGDLQAHDVRLTMGGEPTFVSVDDRESAEWKIAALGEGKKERGSDMFLRLKDCFAPGGLLFHGQGKWYPGEILPRWSFNCYWLKDGKPIWEDDAFLAESCQDYGHDVKTAERFMTCLTESLNLPCDAILPAREDAAYYLWKENRLPIEGDIYKTNLFEKTERKRLQKMLDSHLADPVGFVLPLTYSQKKNQWISNLWKFRSGRLILAIGDSPIGLRLPLHSLPHVPEAEEETFAKRDPFQQMGELQTMEYRFADLTPEQAKAASSKSFEKDSTGLVRHALCAESREGKLHLFLPPISHIEHFLELVGHIENVAKHLGIPVILEGYAPPSDPRIQNFKVTPDPGVLEINMQPAESWDELVDITQTIYKEARLARLTPEKFQPDGRRTGSGGGHHLVTGAALPEDSPFLRRPDLLKSLILFWQNHPSLSYFFSSLFIGPTSQAPRIDEARHESLYELDIAFEQISEKEEVPLWLVDRLFRNLLTDLTGNTHRAEFCIDKLYSPDSSTGRLGLLEMRGFEMAPHPQMSLLMSLLVRACIACFWKTPYNHKLIRWGTRLHDQFMLPQRLWEDLADVVQFLNSNGYSFQLDWFRPFLEFRFPKYGSTQIGPVKLELRLALEAWNVMGEELYQGAVSRGVDAAVERLQVKIEGFIDSRYVVTCNGRRLPLKPTSENGTFIAGVRFKAWPTPSGLHPTLPVNSPLVFDVIDLRYNRSIGGCTYHVEHQGGRNEEDLPMNEQAAEGRCLSRFQEMGHSPDKCKIPLTEINPEFPHTLDLRKKGP